MAGRRSRDAQLFFVNGRPIDPPKRVAKLINVPRLSAGKASAAIVNLLTVL